jgi:glycosyltransferase involved in cell wall biosynthesis
MKILQLISSGGFYGAESVLLNLSVELQHIGHRCTVGVFENSANRNTEVADRSAARGLRVVRVPCRGQMDWGAVREVRRIIEEEDVDLVHAHGYKADFYALLARRRTTVPAIATCHNWPGRSLSMRAYGWLDRYLLRFFDGVAAVSSSVADQLVKAGVRQEVRLISNGVTFASTESRFDVSGEFRQADRIVVGTVGRLSAEKGTTFLIEAAGKICGEFPNVLFVQVGDGPLRNNLEMRVRELGIERQFLFAGRREDIAQVYRSFDVFVLASLTEGMPMVLLEAMAAGLPVVATKVGAVPEVIGHPSAGTLVEPGDSNALATGIRDFLASKTRREEVGANAKMRAEDQFSASAMARKYVDLYQQVLLRQSTRKKATTVSASPAKRDAM